MVKQMNLDVLCFGGGDWWYHSRNHYDVRTMEVFAKYGKVLFINSIVMQKPKISQGRRFINKLIRKARSISRGLEKSGSGFWVYSPFSLPLHHVVWLRPLNNKILQLQVERVNCKLGIRNPILWVVSPPICDIAIRMKKARLVYQRTDLYEEYPNIDVQTIRQFDLKLKANADLTLFVNRKLYEEEGEQCKKAIYVDHGVNYEMFVTAENNREVFADIRSIRRPIVGFFGGIDDHTFDVDFVEKVIDRLPQMSFVFVGPASSDCSGLLAKNNVRMLGQKPYEQIPHYGKCFDVAIMPWKQNRWIQGCNPIKLKEYLALGKPIVSTPFAELQKYYDVVYEAKSPIEFAECIKRALAEDNAEWITARRAKVQASTWDSKAQLVLDKLFVKGQESVGSD